MARHEPGAVCVQGGWRPKKGEPRQLFGMGKTLLERKLSGVFEYRVVRRSSMLFRGCDDVFMIPHSRHTTVDEEAVRAHPELKVLVESDDADILNAEYRRDGEAGLDVPVPAPYYPGDNPEEEPVMSWRAHAHLVFANRLNYFVYRETPYDPEVIS